jgi:8-oxo-dGTP pyrophosphatase MutT (NUDIX family)
MSGKFKSYSAVFPLIFQTDGDTAKILLHRRQNTGYQDGKWDFAGSGHVDEGETAREATMRECKEELGIDVAAADLVFVHLSHRLPEKEPPDGPLLDKIIRPEKRTYYDIYFEVKKYTGVPSVMEPEKCSEMAWFDTKDLPSDMIDCRKAALRAYKDGVYYGEIVE